MTIAEWLTQDYPDHYQRLVECMYAENETHFVEYRLGREWTPKTNLADLFVWVLTPEGFDYWHSLAGHCFKEPVVEIP
jgi:hypothetical protein